MLVILTRTIIIFVFLLIGLRLMGKRQIGELQPFEFVITLAIAELACTPMQDISIPLLYGLVPLFVVFLMHYFITLLSTKSIGFRKFLNGKPIIVVSETGIDYSALKKLNMNVNDLMESIRSQGYFSIPEVKFAVLETNGNLSILENSESEKPATIPLSVIVEGKYLEDNLAMGNLKEEDFTSYLQGKNLKPKDVALMTVESGNCFVQPIQGKYFTDSWGGQG